MDSSHDHARLDTAEERELAAYLEDVISGVLARRALEVSHEAPEDLLVEMALDSVVVPSECHDESAGGGPGDDGSEIRVAGPRKGSGRSSMRSELMDLFRRTEGTSVRGAPSAVPEAAGVHEVADASREATASVYLQLFLRQMSARGDLWTTGIADLDRTLAGGLAHGLHLIAGPDGAAKTAFLESMLWEATSGKRPVVYYSLKDGPVTTWMRLISALGAILDGPRVALGELRCGCLEPGSLEIIESLDARLQQTVLPLLALVDAVPAHADVLGAFLRDAGGRVAALESCLGLTPVILLDELDLLLQYAGDPPAPAALSRLDEALLARSLTMVATIGGRCLSGLGPAQPRVQTVLEITPIGERSDPAVRALELSVERNARTGSAGTIRVILDDSSGLFAC